MIGNALLGWELGKKGFIRAGLEGPRNPRVVFAIACFLVMLGWGSAAKLEPAFSGWRDFWPLLVAGGAFALGRLLTPRSQRLYERAKSLHETTYVGNWRKPREDEEIREALANRRLREAERLYLESAAVQQRLIEEASGDLERRYFRRNVIVVHCQLSLLYLMQGRKVEAGERALEAFELAQREVGEREDAFSLQSLSEALYCFAQAQHLLGDSAGAVAPLRRALAIDVRLGNVEGARATRALLEEVGGSEDDS